MADAGAPKRPDEAYENNLPLCRTCELGFREYWSVLAMMRQQHMPEAGKPVHGYGFATPPGIADRVPMCRSAMPICEGMRGLLCLKFGAHDGKMIAARLEPVVLH